MPWFLGKCKTPKSHSEIICLLSRWSPFLTKLLAKEEVSNFLSTCYGPLRLPQVVDLGSRRTFWEVTSEISWGTSVQPKPGSHFFLGNMSFLKLEKNTQIFKNNLKVFKIWQQFFFNFLTPKTWKNCPQKLLIIGPQLFFSVPPKAPNAGLGI